jgi:hypothetical protein
MQRYLFDAGPEGAAITSGNSGATVILSGGATAVYANAAAAHGAFGALVTTGSSTAVGVLRASSDADNNVQAASVVYSQDSLPTSGALTFITARTNPAAIALRVQWLASGAVQIGDQPNNFTTIAAAGVLSLGAKYRFELLVSGGSTTSGTYSVRVFNASNAQVAYTGVITSRNLTANPITAFDFGNQGGLSTTINQTFDDVQIEAGRTTEIGAYVPGVNAPPVVSATASPSTTTPGTQVSLSGTATDADGSIASVAWVFTSVPAGVTTPAITGSSSTSASFTPTVAGVYTVRLTATDNSAASSSSSVTVYVGGTTVSVISVTSNNGAWTVTPSSSTTATALSDSDPATYIESPASPTTAATERLRLGPLQSTITTFTLTLGGATVTGSGALNFTVTLYEGTTVRKTWSGLSPSGADVVLTLTSAEMATINSWNALDVELSVVAA